MAQVKILKNKECCKKERCIMIKGSIKKEETAIVNIYAPNI